MMYFGRWNYLEVLNLPIGLRNWYYKLLTKQKKTEAEAMQPKNKTRHTS